MAEKYTQRESQPSRRRVDGARLRLLELAPGSTLKELLVATLDLAEELTGSQVGFFHFVDDDLGSLHLQAWSTNTVARMCTAEGSGSHYPIDKAGVWADCVRTGKPVVHDDYPSLPGRKGMPEGHAAIARELTVPVVRAGRVVAALGVGNKPTGYDDRDVADVSALADLAWDMAARKRAEEQLARSEARYRALFESMMDGLVVVDMEGLIVDSNETYRRMLGYTADELRSLTYRDLTPERWHAFEARIVSDQILSRGYSDVYEKEYRRRDGSVFAVELRAFLLEEGGKPSGIWAIVRDVTERQRAATAAAALHAAVQKEKDLLAALLQSIGDEVWFADTAGRFTLANPSGLTAFNMTDPGGIRVEDMARSLEVLRADGTPRPPEEAPPLRALGGTPVIGEEEIVRTPATGELRNRVVTATPVRDPSGNVIGSVSLVRDVTDRRRAEDALRASEKRFRGLVRYLPIPIASYDLQGRVITLNERFTEVLGYTLQDIPTVNDWFMRAYPDLAYRDQVVTAWREAERRALETGAEIEPGEFQVVARDGAVHTMLIAGVPIEDTLLVTFVDVTERKQIEEALRQSERRFRLLASEMPTGIFQTDAGGSFTYVNPAWTRLTGLSVEDAVLRGGLAAIHPEDRDDTARAWAEALAEGGGFSREYRNLLPDGTVVWVRTFASPIRDGTGAVAGFVGAVVDISESRKLQSQLALSSRLASMGTLVAGVAHEVNNPLAAGMADQGIVLEIARDIRARLQEPGALDRREATRQLDDAIEALEEAQESSHRIARIVKNLTAYGRPDPRRKRVRLGDVVTEAMRWLPPAVGQVATVQVEDGGAPDVVASAGQVEQVVVNLVTNAARSFEPGKRGLILLRLGPGTEGMSRLEVVDQGRGIEPALLERIFEPFFTTRPAGEGRGMGLGLAICHAIVTSHGGTIAVSSEPGKGSTFRVELPAAPRD